MKFFSFLLGLVFSCSLYAQDNWKDVVVVEDLEVYVDTLSIEYKDNYYYAWVKTVYLTENSQSAYVDKIRKSYKKQDEKLEKKLKKWDGFKYNISYRMYDCLNKRYKVLEVTDYSANGKKIIKTKPNKNNVRWLNVGTDTMGDYTLFFICDFDSK